ncbi:MAG: putative endopeptidase [Sphingomonadales bacterium]|nr:putative endopeptidase [Sphingomonadales bacterium]
MSRLVSVIALLAVLIASPRGDGLAEELARTPAAPTGDYAPWGFDISGADFKTRPGDDFYRYGNGAWYDRTVIAPDRSDNSIDRVLIDTAEARIRDILERGADGADPSARADAAKIASFYAAFMDEARAEALDLRPIAPLLQRIRDAGSHDELAGLMGEAATTFFDSLFGLSIGIDSKAPERYAVSIGQGGLGLPNRDYYLAAQFADKKAAYRAYIAQILEMIGWDAPQDLAAAILAFETEIAEASWTPAEQRDSEKVYNPMGMAELEAAAPFPWRRLLQTASLAQLERVVLLENTAIPKLAAIYARTPVATLQAWQAFHLAAGAAPLLSKRFVNASFEFSDKTLRGIAQLPERWKRGVAVVNGAMGEAIGRVYVARYFPPGAKAQIEALVGQLRQALKARLERLDWMSDDTKLKALEKLARLNVKIAYPDKWRDYATLTIRRDDLVADWGAARTFEWLRNVNRLNAPVDRDEWDMTPQTVNAYNSSNLNEIVFPAAILQPPYFDPAADAAVNYGSIGAVIGHELTHAFDDDGRKFDATGALSNWWLDSDVEQFNARAAELGRQYAAFEPFPGVHVNGDLTMGENIADLGGALVALDAYHLSLAGRPAPVLDGLSGDQRFFLSFAQSWRRKVTEDAVRDQLVSNQHAPEQYRVNGVVRNMDAWYDAFGVAPADKLYLAPALRVRIW